MSSPVVIFFKRASRDYRVVLTSTGYFVEEKGVASLGETIWLPAAIGDSLRAEVLRRALLDSARSDVNLGHVEWT